jgi:hypothetical protein
MMFREEKFVLSDRLAECAIRIREGRSLVRRWVVEENVIPLVVEGNVIVFQARGFVDKSPTRIKIVKMSLAEDVRESRVATTVKIYLMLSRFVDMKLVIEKNRMLASALSIEMSSLLKNY